MLYTLEIANPVVLEDVPGIGILAIRKSPNGFTNAIIEVSSALALDHLDSIHFFIYSFNSIHCDNIESVTWL